MLAKYGLPIRKMFAEKIIYLKNAIPDRLISLQKACYKEENISKNSFNRLFSLPSTGKSLSEELILASTNPQYDDRLFIELQVQYMKIARTEHVVYTNWFFVFVLTFRTFYVHNMF